VSVLHRFKIASKASSCDWCEATGTKRIGGWVRTMKTGEAKTNQIDHQVCLLSDPLEYEFRYRSYSRGAVGFCIKKIKSIGCQLQWS
jgi:hypothetical protein